MHGVTKNQYYVIQNDNLCLILNTSTWFFIFIFYFYFSWRMKIFSILTFNIKTIWIQLRTSNFSTIIYCFFYAFIRCLWLFHLDFQFQLVFPYNIRIQPLIESHYILILTLILNFTALVDLEVYKHSIKHQGLQHCSHLTWNQLLCIKQAKGRIQQPSQTIPLSCSPIVV